MAVTGMRTGIVGVFIVGMSLIFAIASGLMIAPAIAFAAIVSFPVKRSDWQFERFPWPVVPTALFLAWLGLSFLWSPYDNPEQIPKTLLGVPLYVIFAWRAGHLAEPWRRRMEAAFLFTALALGVFLLGESLTNGAGTRSFKMAMEGLGELDARSIEIQLNRSLGHAAAPLVLMALPVALIAWRHGAPIIGGVILLLAGVSAFSFSTEVNAAAYVIGGAFAALAWFRPRATILGLFLLVGAGLLLVPMLLPELINALPQGFKDALPLSWSWRLEIWSHVSGLVREAPLFGHGLDASRPLSHQMVLAGYDVELLPLHPHNAALHVWLETGLVGALLLTATLGLVGHRIAMAGHLTRLQAVSVVWIFMIYVSLVFFSYGLWQEWHQGAVALASIAVFLLGAQRDE